jgi:hypothetical protein
MLPIPNIDGYRLFTEYIHQHPVTGLIHAIFMPLATCGFFLIVFAILGLYMINKIKYYEQWPGKLTKIKNIVNGLAHFILGFVFAGYVTFSPWVGSLTIMFYWYVIQKTVNYAESFEKTPINMSRILYNGLYLLVTSIIIMEFIGHWYLEGKGSDITQLLNSIYHTPLYGTISLIGFVY